MTRETAPRSMLVLFLAALVVGAVSAATARGGGPAQAGNPSIEEQARKLVEAGHTDEAERILRQALESHPADLDARLLLANIYAGSNELSQAEQEFREALRRHPESAAAALALGKFYVSTGSFNQSEQVLAQGLRHHPQLADLRMQLTLALAGEHKFKEALTNLRLIVRSNDPVARVRYYRLAASIHSGLGDKSGAARDMESALAVMPADPQLRLLTSLTEADAEDWSACARDVAPLFAKNPTPKTGLLLLRAQLSTHQQFTTTLQTLRTLNLPDDQRFDLRVHAAEILASADQHESAAQEFQDAVAISNPVDPTLLYNLAVEQYAASQFEKAESTLDKLRREQDSAEVEDLAADVEERRGDSSAALRSHQNAVTLAPKEERYRLALGAALVKYRAYAPAAEAFEQATRLFPNSARAYVGLGMAEYLIEKYDESVSAFLRAAQLDSDSERALSYLGATQVESPAGPSPSAMNAICGRAETHPRSSISVTWCGALLFRKAYLAGDQPGAQAAILRLHSAATLAPKDPVANCYLGRALMWTGQNAEARPSLEICVQLRPESAEEHYRLSRLYQEMKLKQPAAEQDALASKLSAQPDREADVAQKLTREMLDERQSVDAGK
jgi:tetratricopeptide (TPR) repeat protein